MINFPTWVELPKRQPAKQLAIKRLRYVVLRAVIERTSSGHIAAFAESIGMDKSTIHNYIKLGKFSRPAADIAERIYGKDLIRAEWLTNPLDIDQK
jgi:hypothetical protein